MNPETERPPADGTGGRAGDLAGAGINTNSTTDTRHCEASRATEVTEVPVDLIGVDPEQPRRHFDDGDIAALAGSIAANGLLHPLTVRPSAGRYVTVTGERRLRALQYLGAEFAPCVVREVDPGEAIWLQATENLARSDMSPTEEAAVLARLTSAGATHAEIANRLGVSRSVVSQKLRLRALPPAVELFVARGVLSEGHARQLLRFRSILDGGIDSASEWRTQTEHYDRFMAEDNLAAMVPLQTRPLDGPIFAFWIPPESPHRDLLLLAVRTWLTSNVSRDTDAPSWERVATHFAIYAVGGEMTVSELAESIDLYADFIGSALWGVVLEHYGAPLWPEDSREWWGYRADLRHAGLGRLQDDRDGADALFASSPLAARLAASAVLDEQGEESTVYYMPPSAVVFDQMGAAR